MSTTGSADDIHSLEKAAAQSDARAIEAIENEIPDGGLAAWLVVLGGFCLSFATFGYVVSWGTFQEYYQAVALRERSASDMYVLPHGFAAPAKYALIFLPGLLTGRLFDLGFFRWSLLSSTALYIASNFLIAQCTRYWHFVLCQGLALGLSAGWIYIPCIAVVSHWFQKNRPIAFSVIAFGSSVGGVVIPIVFRQLLPQIGFRWTVRVIAFVNLACFLVANVTMRARLPPKGGKAGIDFRSFLSTAYVLYVLATFFSFLGLYSLLTFISVYAVSLSIDASLAFYLVSVANATSAAGRLLAGVLAVRFGALNVMALFTAGAAATTYAWPFVHSRGGFVALVCVYGVTSGAFVSLFPVPVAQLGATHDVGVRTGVQMTVMALGALGGPPISGAILQHTGSFVRVGEYAGTMIVVSVVLMVLARWARLGRLVGGKF
ncbi:MFS general substrate transporter [Artomyces pyxidatus]|uniref:MFS general substrate transporter n=1 Tax=Artomyces pyxidatus TaxID=48021 RepID=A0ACB8SM75_9AGAM|nr:MFS general substrate transporter [Artomyces pyxidatus]